MKFSCTEEFLKDFKKLKKKIHSLESDLDNFKKFIPAVDFNSNKRFITLVPYSKKGARITKTRLMVRSLKGSSMTRVIFAFCIREDLIEFIEIYLKNEKSRGRRITNKEILILLSSTRGFGLIGILTLNVRNFFV